MKKTSDSVSIWVIETGGIYYPSINFKKSGTSDYSHTYEGRIGSFSVYYMETNCTTEKWYNNVLWI